MDREKLERTSRFLAPSLFTMGNMACGFYSLLSAQRGEFTIAASAIILGVVFDSLDGRVARLVHGESAFGVEFDSLSDFLTFGVAPAHLMYAFILKNYGAWGVPMAFLFALCGALRLARFNAGAHETGGSKTHFEGLPAPAGAGFLASFVLLYQIVEEGKPAHTWKVLMNSVPFLYGFVPLMVIVIALLMVSTVPYPSFKNSGGSKRSVKVVILFFLAGLITFIYPQNTLFLFTSVYVLTGPIVWLSKISGPRWRGDQQGPRPGPGRPS